jgi:uncharacterized RDD family membrane protein YckC
VRLDRPRGIEPKQIAVDATTGARISVLQSIGRFFGYLLSIWVLCLGLIWVGLDTNKQGWHDKLAHTYVLRQHRF